MSDLNAERWNKLFRTHHRPVSAEELATMQEIKTKAAELAELMSAARESGRHLSLALTALEQSVMWSIKGITE